MAKPTKNRIVTGSACLNYVDNAIGLVGSPVSFFDNGLDNVRFGLDALDVFYAQCGESATQRVAPTTYESYFAYVRSFNFMKFHHNNRVVGLILDDNDDGSYKIALLGTDTIKNGDDGVDFCELLINMVSDTSEVDENDNYEYQSIPVYGANDGARYSVRLNGNLVDVSDIFDLKLNFIKYDNTQPFPLFYSTGEYRGQDISSYAHLPIYSLSSNKNNTLILGKPISEIITGMPYNSHCFMYDTYNSQFDAWEGDFYNLLNNIYSLIMMQSMKKPASVISEGGRTNFYTRADVSASPKLAGYEGKTHAFNFTPFNLILTRNESQALAYLNNGTLPSDAFLYPLDWQNLPRTDGTPSSDEEDPDYKPPSGENGDSGIDGTPTTDADPQITSNMLTNNNLYWLQAGQLESFITWFWQNAGEIIEVDDLWDRIKGLYNDLASAIINIRYFPVDPYYIGGVSDTTNIVLSSIEMPISGIKKLNKTKLRKRTLGEISIPNKYNAFTDYSPYTSLMLYLPFHGWIDLDIDIFTGNKLQVRCVYDHISGTIQYGVYVISKGKEFLLNTVIAKMAVDIPITLQSKNDRDSAIFNNVTNAFGNLLGAVHQQYQVTR